MYNELSRKILINKKYFLKLNLCLSARKREMCMLAPFVMLMIFCSLLSVV